MNTQNLEAQWKARIENLQGRLVDYINNSNLLTNKNDPEVGPVFFSQSMARIHTFDVTIPTVEEAQTWVDETTSTSNFLKKYRRPMRMVIRQQDSGKPWPASWICEYERDTDAVFITFCPGPLHRGALIYELAQVLRAESYPRWPAKHDREFRRVWLDLVGTYGTYGEKRWLKRVFNELKLPFTAIRRSEYDGMT